MTSAKLNTNKIIQPEEAHNIWETKKQDASVFGMNSK